MAERTVSVRLTAKTEQYQKAMGEAQSATKKLESEGGRSMAQLGASMQKAGVVATAGVTLPLIGVGAASVKMASNFDASMSKIVGLVGLSADEVDGMKASVLELAGSTATAPQELADALFVVTSAGLKGADAMDALEYAAKASAAGLGETEDIARAVSGAMNAYGPGVLDAAKATDVLTATARAGNFETSQLASSLGKVLPFAKQAQASFEDVGGAVALLTRTNGNASESVTQIQALMRAFVVPTAEAASALDKVGLSAEDVRDSIGQNGLVATLEMLDGKLGGNREQLGRLLGSSEAASAAFQILDADAQSIADTFGVTANATGMVGEAFDAAASTDAFKFEQAMIDLKVAMIQIGAVIGPTLADLAGGVSSLAGAFSDLDPTLQKVVIGIAGAAAAAGPLLIVTGSLIKNYTLLTAAMASSNTTMAASATGLAKFAAIGVTAFASFKAPIEGLRGNLQYVYEDVSLLEKPMQHIARTIFEANGGVKDASTVWREFGEEAEAAFGTVTAGVYTMEQLSAKLKDSTLSTEAQNLITIEFRKQLDAQEEAEQNLIQATEQKTAATDKATDATEDGTDATAEATGAIKGQISAAKIIQNEIDRAGSNMRRFGADGVENMGAVDSAADEAAAGINELTAQFQRLRGEIEDRSAYLSLEDQLDSVAAAQTAARDAAVEGSEDAEGAARDHEQAVLTLKGQVMDYAEEVGNISPEQVTDIIADIDRGKLAEAEAALRELERTRQVRVNIVSYYSAVGSSREPVQPNRGGARAHGGQTYGGYMHEVNENGSELLTEGGKTYLMAARDGFVTPLSTVGAGSSVTNGGDTYAINVENNRRDLTPEDLARSLRLARFAA